MLCRWYISQSVDSNSASVPRGVAASYGDSLQDLRQPLLLALQECHPSYAVLACAFFVRVVRHRLTLLDPRL